MKIPFRDNREDWVIVLELMYENKIVVDPSISAGWMDSKELNRFVLPAFEFYEKVEPEVDEDIDLIIEYLEELNFVKVNRGTDYSDQLEDTEYKSIDASVPVPGLTQEGLQFAYQIKTERQRRNTNILLSGGIILVSLLILFAQIRPLS